ncbi:MAG: hypothetical protein ABI716_03045 [Candidatus Saccharibacteria bacterium]
MKKMVQRDGKPRTGFTIVEILIIIIVIVILATIVYISYAGVKQQAQNMQRKNDMKSLQMTLETYAAHNGGVYPATTANPAANWKTVDVRMDANCFNGSPQADWIPGLATTLPQSVPNIGSSAGVDGKAGCYLYASNGIQYVLSAWNMLSNPQTDTSLYRRLGFRAFQTSTSTQFYSCNDNVIGGANGKGYDISKDYYKHSYVISNITDCDETPPSGA